MDLLNRVSALPCTLASQSQVGCNLLPPEMSAARSLKVLYFTPHEAWPANTGARIRDYQLARQLAARCSVTIAEMAAGRRGSGQHPTGFKFDDVITLKKERAYTPLKVLRGLAGPLPVTVLNCWSRQMALQLAFAVGSCQFDTVQMEGVHLLEYVPIIRKALGCAKIIADWHNIESEMMRRYAETPVGSFRRAMARRTATLIERAEHRLLQLCDAHTVTSERERRKLAAMCPDATIHVIPNGVDAAHYSAKTVREARDRSSIADSRPNILFVGSMDFHANIYAVTWFVQQVWPEIGRRYPQIDLTIVGRNPPARVRSLQSDRIHVTGTVDDVRPYYATAVAVIAPIRSGSGTRLKILEAMAAGVPVISTRLGAEGLDVCDGIHLLLADSTQEIATAMSHLMSSPDMRLRLVAAARNLVCTQYDWSGIGEKLLRIHGELARLQPTAESAVGS